MKILAAPEYDEITWPEADAWFWQIGNVWVAVVDTHERPTWFDQGDEAAGVYAERPGDGTRPIADLPTSGRCVFRMDDFELVDGIDAQELRTLLKGR
jgi:hypothetical protein